MIAPWLCLMKVLTYGSQLWILYFFRTGPPRYFLSLDVFLTADAQESDTVERVVLRFVAEPKVRRQI